MLRPEVQSLAWDAFDRTGEAIEAGATAARRAVPRIRKLLDSAAATSVEVENSPLATSLFRPDMWTAEVAQ